MSYTPVLPNAPGRRKLVARYLVVAHRSFGAHLVDHLEELHASDPDLEVHLVVPEQLPFGRLWTHAEVQIQARSVLSMICDRLTALGIAATGEIGSSNPVIAVRTAMRRQGVGSFDSVVLATLPEGVSRLWRRHIPRRLRRAHPELELTHIVADPTDDE